MTGDRSIRGVHPVALDVALEGATTGWDSQPITGWTAETTVDRQDFGLRSGAPSRRAGRPSAAGAGLRRRDPGRSPRDR